MIRDVFILLIFFSFISSQVLADSGGDKTLLEPTKHSLKKYDFSKDFFSGRIPVWNKVLSPFKGKPNIHYLEIGVFEGRSAVWMLENILTHPTSRLTGIDLFQWSPDLKEKYLSNLDVSGFAHKATTIDGFSQIMLRSLPLKSFDIIYIDACHRADCALSDAVLSFELLKPGGLLIFDDYKKADLLPDELAPPIAIDSFITCYRSFVEVVHRGYQVVLKKRESIFESSKSNCTHGYSFIGQYVYFWNCYGEEVFFPQDMSEPIKLSVKEKRLIERLIKSPKFGKTKLFLDNTMSKDKDFISLSKRLKLDFSNIEIEKEPGFFETLSLLGHRLYRFLQSYKRKAVSAFSN